jgi:two-component system chemotaxis response regulator CheB
LIRQVKVLIVDDSALVRQILAASLGEDPGILVVGTAPDPYVARDKILELRPDVMTLDVEMPRMDGVEFLRRLLPQYPIPVVMVSALTQRGKSITLEALEAGAVDFVTKPSADLARGLADVMSELKTKVKIASMANLSHLKSRRREPRGVPAPRGKALSESTDKVVAIGASTGGTEALREVLTRFPADMPGVVVVQHMPAGFTTLFAERLNQLCSMEVREAVSGDRIIAGRVLVAPGGSHLRVKRSGGVYLVECQPGDKVSGHCPSVDVMMASVAEHAGANAVGIVLTGMGHDGSDGLLAMRRQGARTVAQDEATSVVFGMPKTAYEKGGAECLKPLDEIAPTAMGYLGW